MKCSLLFAVFILILLGACAKDEQPEMEQMALTWHSSFQEAQVKAEEEGDLILLSFEAPWCPWSRLTRESLYVNEAVVESLMSIRCVLIDIDRDTSLVREFGIRVYPTSVVTDAYGGEIGRMIGYQTPDIFLGRLARMKSREDVLTQMFRQEEALANDPTSLIAFGKALLEMGLYDGALIRFDRAEKIDKDDRYGTLEEATFSLAEAYMLAGEYREAGRRFRIFARSSPSSPRAEYAAVLAGMCYEQVNYFRVATEVYEDYLEDFEEGGFRDVVTSRRDSLNARRNGAG